MSDARLTQFIAPFAARGFERKILLVHGPTFGFEAFRWDVLRRRGYYAYPPRSLQCLAVAARRDGIAVDILDMNFRLLEALHGFAEDVSVDLYALMLCILDGYLRANPSVRVVGVSSGVIVANLFAVPKHPFLVMLRHLKDAREYLVLAGGPCATIEARKLVEQRYADAVFLGEAEDRLRYFMGMLYDDAPKAERSGIAFLDAGGAYAESVGSDAMVDFRASIIETYADIPVERYNEVGCLSPFSRMAGADKRYASMQLVRGCRMKCTFCGLTRYRGSNQVIAYPAVALCDEIEFLVREKGVRHFEWVDEDPLADRTGFIAVLAKIAALRGEGFDITWTATPGLIAVYVDAELLDRMAESGCAGFRVGIESGNVDMLKRIAKPATLPKLLLASKRFSKHPEMFTVGLYIIGFDGETYEQALDTLRFSIAMRLGWAHFSTYQVIEEAKLGDGAGDCVPSPQKVVGTAASTKAGALLTGHDIGRLHPGATHDPALRMELWFAFNLISSYLLNKNLQPGGNVGQFIRWVGGLLATYPGHPVMHLFLALAYSMRGDRAVADAHYLSCVAGVSESDYWRERFAGYGLNEIVAAYPIEEVDVANFLRGIAAGYQIRGVAE